MDQQRRRIDRILDPAYLGELRARPTDELRAMHDECAEVETEVIEERELRSRFPGEPLRNVNTREELQEAMKLL